MPDQAAQEGDAEGQLAKATDPGPLSDTAGWQPPPTIEQLIREHHVDAFRYAYRLAGDHSDAEDLVQQTFLVAHQKLHQLRDPSRARAWLFSVLRSCFMKSHRRATPVPATVMNFELENVSEDFDPQSLDIDAEQLQAALNQLPEEARLILVMFYYEEASYKDIAEQLDIKLGTVMSRLSRAKERLRKLLFGAMVIE